MLIFFSGSPFGAIAAIFARMKVFKKPAIWAFAVILITAGCGGNDSGTDTSLTTSYSGIKPPAPLPFTVINQYPHDTSAYTQGLQWYKGKLYEGTGDYENSSLRITDRATGKVIAKHMMGSEEIFGEGITILRDTLYQLTWENNLVFVYTINDLSKPVKTLSWPYQGWGITNNGSELIISDGSANLFFVNPVDFKVISTVRVADNRGNVSNLNELEFINGKVYANIYLTNDIIEIDPESGHVTGRITFDNLLSREDINRNTDVFNGIAYDSTTQTILVTGKRWPKLFEIKMR